MLRGEHAGAAQRLRLLGLIALWSHEAASADGEESEQQDRKDQQQDQQGPGDHSLGGGWMVWCCHEHNSEERGDTEAYVRCDQLPEVHGDRG